MWIFKKVLFIALIVAVLASICVIPVCASGDVAGAIQNTWDAAKSQIKTIVNNVVFPVIDVILAVLLFTKIGLAYTEYRKHGQIEWTGPAILFGCLIFTLTAPLYVWSIVGM